MQHLRAFLAWSPDRRYVIHTGTSDRAELVERDTRSGVDNVIAWHSRDLLSNVSVAPAQDWIAFRAITRGMVAWQIFLAPFQPNRATTEEDWIALTPSGGYSFGLRWSPDGNRVYYISAHGGPVAIWAQNLDRMRSPVGDPVHVYSGGNGKPRLYPNPLTGMGPPTIAVAEDFLILDTAELRSNIWLLEPDAAAE